MPTPHGDDLIVSVACTTGPDQPQGVPHEIVIRADWTVETPAHDIDADRVARAFGGWADCSYLADSVVPMLRHRLEVMHRPRSVLERSAAVGWRNMPQDGCAHGAHHHRALVDAVGHEVSIEHAFATRSLAAGEHAVAWGLALLLDLSARDAWFASIDDDLVIGGKEGYHRLWHRGVLPEQAMATARALPRRALPLPVDFLAQLHFAELELSASWSR